MTANLFVRMGSVLERFIDWGRALSSFLEGSFRGGTTEEEEGRDKVGTCCEELDASICLIPILVCIPP